MLFWLLLTALICAFIYYFVIQPFMYWKKRGVAHKPPLPIIGNFLKVMAGKEHFYDNIIRVYNDFPNSRYNGIFQFTMPSLVIRDLELIKRINVKDFDHFTDHRDTGSKDLDDLFSKNLFQLNGQKWRDMRALLSPAFTGSKMKSMFVLMSDCAQQMVDYFNGKNEELIEMEMKDLFTRYANDVIATCAFGLKCDSLKEQENTFFMMGKNATTFSRAGTFKFLLANFMPWLTKLLRFSVFPESVTNYFINVIKETISYRQEHHVIRPDMIHLLLEARKGKLRHENSVEDTAYNGFSAVEESSIGRQEINNKEITDIDIAAQAFIFFFAGFDTASTMLSFLSTELAINTDVQEKLFNEIDEVMVKCNGKPGYEDIMHMKYLDMVLSESLRKWPPGPMTDRKCTKPYKIEAVGPNEKDLLLEVDEIVLIPILGIHRDEKYYPNPDRFDPERFSDENKGKIVPFSYLPFGVGPRNCIGSRFALLEIKILIVHLMWKYEFVPVEKTVIPITIATKGMKIQPKGGFWLGLKRRQLINL